MSYHKLLEKQISKHLPQELRDNVVLKKFLCTINDSYNAYERDAELAERAFRISEDEYMEINERLQQEAMVKKQSIERLTEAIEFISDIKTESDDLLAVAEGVKNEVYKRKNAEKTLMSLITNMQSGVLLEDETRHIVFTNQLFCDMFAIPVQPELLVGSDCSESAEQSSHLFKKPKVFIQNINRILKEQKLVNGEILELADGKIFERDYIPIFIEQKYKGHLWTYTDVTQKKKAEEFIRTTLDKLGDNVWEHDFVHNVTSFSKSNVDIIGYNISETTNVAQLWHSCVHPDDKRLLIDLDNKYKSGIIDHHVLECRMMHADGSVRWILDRGVVVEKNLAGVPLKIIGTHTDITRIKLIEQALRESEKQLRSLAENIPGVLYTYHQNNNSGEFVYISPNAESKIGLTEEQLRNYNQIIHPNDLERELEIRKETSKKLKPYHFDGRFLVPDKPVIWLSISSSVTSVNDDGTVVYTGIILNTTKEKEAELAMQLREEKYRSIIANMNLGLMEVDNNDTIQFVNNSFCEMSGYSEEELTNQKASNIFLRGSNTSLMEHKTKLRESGYSDAYEIAVKTKRGKLKWWLISGAPRYNDKGHLVGSIGIHLDITGQKKLQEQLIQARKQAEESAKSKQIFLANMSHEIRTPMNAIIGMSNQLVKTTLNSNQQLYVDTINKASNNLLVVINDILDLSKLEAGKLDIENIEFDFKKVVHDALSVVNYKAEEKGLTLKLLQFDDNIAAALLGDPFRINQVLLNILTNAIKFTNTGAVYVRCYVETNNSQAQVICTQIEDTGIGMNKDFVERIFDAFNQESKSTTRKYGGTGLGMNICKQLVEMMGGQIEVTSTKDVGTTVKFSIVCTKALKTTLTTKSFNTINFDVIQNKTILVADDNDMNRLLLQVILQNCNVAILEAANGHEAINILKQQSVDLVLMDIQMPVMDGIQATQIIRDELGSMVPIIALTANAIKGESVKYIDAGMNAYVSKPVNEDELLRTIIKCLNETIEAETFQTEEEHLIANQNQKLYDLSKLFEISRGNTDFVLKMIKMFIQQSSIALNDIENALINKDYKTAASALHKLKPSIGNICVQHIFANTKKLEELLLTNGNYNDIRSMFISLQSKIILSARQLQEEVKAWDKVNTL